MNGSNVIVGVGHSQYGRETGRTSLRLHYEAGQAALRDAGLEWGDVDGLFSCSVSPALHGNLLPEYLGIRPRYVDSTSMGGGTWEMYVEHACAALDAGLCDVALLLYGSAQRTEFGSKLGTGFRARGHGVAQYYAPFGLTIVGAYAMAAQAHMARYGTTPENLAEIAVSTRRNAQRNPDAMYREPITVEDVLESRMIADPLHLLDCCVISDGGGAVVLTRSDRAKDLRQPGVRVLGAGTAVTHDSVVQMPDLTSLDAAKLSSERAFSQAGITAEDVDLLQVYDSYTITALLTLEALGFCKPGDGGAFVSDGRTAWDGALPMNTDGGGLSSNHPGMRGIFLLIEAVRQLRQDDLPWRIDRPFETAVCHGTGGQLSSCGTVVLGVDR